MKFYLIIIFLLFACNNKVKRQDNLKDISTDSLSEINTSDNKTKTSIDPFVFSDTTFISRNTSRGFYHAIYIENNKKSKHYDRITNFKFDSYYSLTYNGSIKEIFGGKPVELKRKKIAFALPRQWCSLNSYKDKLYLYAPCDRGNNSNLIINDTTIIRYFMDGPYAFVIDSFKTIDNSTFEFSVRSAYSTTTKMTVYIIDRENQLAIFDNHNDFEGDAHRYSLMVGSSKTRHFPIIVNYCKDRKELEFDNFDKIDYKKLFLQMAGN